MGWKPLSLLVVGAVATLACTKIFDDVPGNPSSPNSTNGSPSPSPVPIPVVVVPVPLPTAPPTTLAPAPPPANPNPNPNPNPPSNPAPAPPNPPSSGSCSLPRGSGNGQDCPRLSASFQGEVNEAITQLIQQRPDIFGAASGPNRLVLKHDDYMNGVVGNLRARGLCAIVDSDDEIAVKNTNTFNDQYDILASSGNTRADGSYSATCSPAWF